jgi:malonyl CoA-acyl carrier protein transacylase
MSPDPVWRVKRDIIEAIGFFPGLGSLDAYRDLGATLHASGIPQVRRIYRDAAAALGYTDDVTPQPERLFFTDANLPSHPAEKAGLLTAAFLVHNLALLAHFEHHVHLSRTTVRFKAFTGESLGVLIAAAASRALSVGDAARVAREFSRGILRSDVPEAFCVLGIQTSEPETVQAALASALGDKFEVHKYFCEGRPGQFNAYVAETAVGCFERLMRSRFPEATFASLKPPTRFLAHSRRMSDLRRRLEAFVAGTGVQFFDPAIPVISNNGSGILATRTEVARAVFAMADEPMRSSETTRIAEKLRADVIIELGLGGKTRLLIERNRLTTPLMEYVGPPSVPDWMTHWHRWSGCESPALS